MQNSQPLRHGSAVPPLRQNGLHFFRGHASLTAQSFRPFFLSKPHPLCWAVVWLGDWRKKRPPFSKRGLAARRADWGIDAEKQSVFAENQCEYGLFLYTTPASEQPAFFSQPCKPDRATTPAVLPFQIEPISLGCGLVGSAVHFPKGEAWGVCIIFNLYGITILRRPLLFLFSWLPSGPMQKIGAYPENHAYTVMIPGKQNGGGEACYAAKTL